MIPQRITDLVELGVVSPGDLLVIVQDPTGGAATKKGTVAVVTALSVQLAGEQIITGEKTFTGGLVVTTLPIVAGTVDADFDAITGTSYGGILEANLLDKTDPETITGIWTFDLGDGNALMAFQRSDTPSTFFLNMAGNDFRLYNESGAGSDFLFGLDASSVDKGNRLGIGITPTERLHVLGNIKASGDVTAATIGGITEANLLDLAAPEVVTGEWNVPSIPQGKTASYTLVLTDAGQTIRFTGATASKVLTIPANASVAFLGGTMIGIENDGSVTMTVEITTDTLTFGKDNTTGTRTLAPGASAVIKKVAGTNWKINGSALVT